MAAGFISKETQGTRFQGCARWEIVHVSISKLYLILFKENGVFNISLCNTILHLVTETHKASLMEKKLQWLFYDSWQNVCLLHCALTSLTPVLIVGATLHDLAFEEHYNQYCSLIKLNTSLFLPHHDAALARYVQPHAPHWQHLNHSDVMQKHISQRRVIK